MLSAKVQDARVHFTIEHVHLPALVEAWLLLFNKGLLMVVKVRT